MNSYLYDECFDGCGNRIPIDFRELEADHYYSRCDCCRVDIELLEADGP